MNILKILKDFFACKSVLVPNHHYPESIQRLFRLQKCLRRKSSLSWKYSKTFRLQNCLSRKSSLSWKHSKTFSPAKLSSTQVIIILKTFKNFFACKIFLAANHQYPENTQRLFRLQNWLSSKSSLSWNCSKTFSPANFSHPQIIIILKIFKAFFACEIALAANHHYPENIQRFSACKILLAGNHPYPGKIQRLFCLQNCLSRKSSLSWKDSKTFSPAKMSWRQIINILKILKDLFACKIVLVPNHHYPESIQRLFRLKNVFSANHHYPENIQRPFACKIVLAANHNYHGNIQRLFRPQNCLRRKSSLSWKHSKTSPAKFS